jgi:hypothetical protein
MIRRHHDVFDRPQPTGRLFPLIAARRRPFVVNCATKCQAKDISNYRFPLMKSTSAGRTGRSQGDLRQKAASAAKLR